MTDAAIPPTFRVLVLHENSGHHIEYSKRARVWLDALADARGFAVDYIQNTEPINNSFLSQYALFVQLDYPPYGWTDIAAAAFENYITNGLGGWVGFHHASLLGEFDGYPMWKWFSAFLGDITYANYISTFARGEVRVENADHPVMKGVPATFWVEQEEWYTYNRSPRPNVQVLASVEESTYQPDTTIKMGDHPVVWTNPNFPARNLYIFMGHSPDLFVNDAYTALVQNSLFWAAGK